MDRVNYYLDVLASVCGIGAADTITALGLSAVLLATVVLVYAVYRAVYVTIWPGEKEADHIKRRILIEEGVIDEN